MWGSVKELQSGKSSEPLLQGGLGGACDLLSQGQSEGEEVHGPPSGQRGCDI